MTGITLLLPRRRGVEYHAIAPCFSRGTLFLPRIAHRTDKPTSPLAAQGQAYGTVPIQTATFESCTYNYCDRRPPRIAPNLFYSTVRYNAKLTHNRTPLTLRVGSVVFFRSGLPHEFVSLHGLELIGRW